MKTFKQFNKDEDVKDFEEDLTANDKVSKNKSNSKEEEKKEEKNENF